MSAAHVDDKYTHPLHDKSDPYWFGDHPPPFIRSVTVDQSARWLARGWQDVWASPAVSLSYGLMFVIAAYLIVFGLQALGMESLILPLTAGFMLIGPLAAVGLYDVSQRHTSGEPITFIHALDTFRKRSGPLMLVGFTLMLMLMVWILVALLIFAAFYHSSPPTIGMFFTDMLTAPQAPAFILVGTVAGAIIAAMVFTISAVSLPMIIDRNVSPIYAMAVSVRAVLHNWRVMIGWAVMIALVTGFGMATFFIGLIIALPVIGHATWHSYKAMVD